MRINVFVAQASGLSRRSADSAIAAGKVRINGQTATLGQTISSTDHVTLDSKTLNLNRTTTIMLNKPVGYVCSRQGQGSRTIYDLLPPELHHLKPVGRLDKDSSGLLLLTNDGRLANHLTHPRYAKEKIYKVALDKPLVPDDQAQIEQGVQLDDGPSKLQIKDQQGNHLIIVMHEGRNRQIRRTFDALGYTVTGLHRTSFGDYELGDLPPGQLQISNH